MTGLPAGWHYEWTAQGWVGVGRGTRIGPCNRKPELRRAIWTEESRHQDAEAEPAESTPPEIYLTSKTWGVQLDMGQYNYLASHEEAKADLRVMVRLWINRRMGKGAVDDWLCYKAGDQGLRIKHEELKNGLINLLTPGGECAGVEAQGETDTGEQTDGRADAGDTD